MLAVFLAGVFVATVLAYACTEYLIALFDARRGVLVGRGFSLLIMCAVNFGSFVLVVLSAFVFIAASGASFYGQAVLVCACAQTVWLGQHLWFYYRDHLRLRYES